MEIDLNLLKELEKSIDTSNPEAADVPIKILGYGEISLVFEIIGDPQELAYKRIPIFDNEKQVKRHIWAYNAYNKLLMRIGLTLPDYGVAWFKYQQGQIQFYCVQKKIDANSVGNKVIHLVSDEEAQLLVLLALREMKKIWDFNQENPNLDIALDGQISNFTVMDFDANNPKIIESTKLMYLDTSTPLFKINGKEAMDAVLFLKSAPSFLRWLLEALFLEDTVERYYDFRRVVIDLIANFYKEQKPELIPSLIKMTNHFLRTEVAHYDIEPLRLDEIVKYYKSDANMWRIFQSTRKLDRFLQTKILRKKYAFYLPGKIQR